MSTVLKNRYEIMALVEAKMCNPNGDPDFGNLPRVDSMTSQGIITDVAFKARMRKYVLETYGQQEGFSVLMRTGNSLNRAIAEGNIAANNGTPSKSSNTQDGASFMCQKYWDVRTFGAVLSTGLNAGQVRGAVQVQMALSVDPIEPLTMSITRDCYTLKDVEDKAKVLNTAEEVLSKYDEIDAKKLDDEKRTIGTKAYCPYGLYVMKVSVSANLAEKCGFTEEDFQILLESIVQMYNMDISSSKAGMSVLSPIMVFKHTGTTDEASNPEQYARECKLGCASAYQLFQLLTIEKKDDSVTPRDYTDYQIQLHLDKLPKGVTVGLKKQTYEPVEWLDTHDVLNIMEL